MEQVIQNRWWSLRQQLYVETGVVVDLERVELRPPDFGTNVRFACTARIFFTRSSTLSQPQSSSVSEQEIVNSSAIDSMFATPELVEPLLSNFSYFHTTNEIEQPYTFYLRTRQYTMTGKSIDVGFTNTHNGKTWSRLKQAFEES